MAKFPLNLSSSTNHSAFCFKHVQTMVVYKEMVPYREPATMEQYVWKMAIAMVRVIIYFNWTCSRSSDKIFTLSIFWNLECALNNGENGDGVSQGSCEIGQLCSVAGVCLPIGK